MGLLTFETTPTAPLLTRGSEGGWLNSSHHVTFENGAMEEVSHRQIQAL
jgi:hypothetical protein